MTTRLSAGSFTAVLGAFVTACSGEPKPSGATSQPAVATPQSQAAAAPSAATDTEAGCKPDTVLPAPSGVDVVREVGTLKPTRVDDGIFVPLRTGDFAVLRDCEEDMRSNEIAGYWARGQRYIVVVERGDTFQSWLVDDSSAARQQVAGKLVLGPDSSRMISWRRSGAENGGIAASELEIWVLDTGALRREIDVRGDSAGPEHPVWVNVDTIDYWRVLWRDEKRVDSSRVRLVRDGKVWREVPK